MRATLEARSGLPPEQIDTLCAFGQALIEKNRVMNLTAITEPQAVAELHFLDCIALLQAEDFSGKKVVAQNASLQQSLVTEQLPSDIQFQPVTAITDGVLMLTTGKADALAVSYDNGEMLMKSYPEIAMTEFKFDHSDEGNVIAVKKGEDELLEALNGIIAEVNESGLYSQWTEEARALAESLGIEMK